MLPKQNRLRAEEVRAVLKSGKTLRTPNIVVKYVRGDGSKFGIAVSKKIAHTAVLRNNIRRAIYRELSHSLPPNTQAVFLVQKSVPDYTSDIKTVCSKLFS